MSNAVKNTEAMVVVSQENMLEKLQYSEVMFNPLFTSGLAHPYHLDEPIPSFRGFWWMFSVLLHFS